MIPFVKVNACGNDFLIVEAERADAAEWKDLAIRLCARHTGVGADGVEFLTWTGERSARIRLLNADGSVAEISGNGTRCVAAWIAKERRAVAGDVILLETDAGVRACRIVAVGEAAFEIATDMAIPEVARAAVSLANGLRVEGAVVSMGNPHFVVLSSDKQFSVAGIPWEEIGREICVHQDFPQQTNVEFIRLLGRGRTEIRIFERGVGPTQSSGTGTCASAAAAMALWGAERELLVNAPGGAQRVHWESTTAQMILTGPAVLVAAGEAWL